MERAAQLWPLGRQTMGLRDRMIRETEDYLTNHLLGRDVHWPPDRGDRKAGVGQLALVWPPVMVSRSAEALSP
jgi:hypothetical protein